MSEMIPGAFTKAIREWWTLRVVIPASVIRLSYRTYQEEIKGEK